MAAIEMSGLLLERLNYPTANINVKSFAKPTQS
jgi:hypothetical protein